MKVLALNSSARTGGESKTELMLNHLVKGMSEAGAEVEVIHLRKKNIKNCIGCFTCMTKTPGRCIHKDDMSAELYPKWLESDLVIYATPLFHYTVNATMKAFIERTWTICEPFLEQHGGRTFHPLRHRHPAIVMLSVAGFPEDSVFDQLSSWANHAFTENSRQPETKLVAEIYRTASQEMIHAKDKLNDILAATRQAGRELVESMAVTPETMARIKQPIDDFESVAEIANLYWNTCIAEGVTPKQFERKGMAPRPDSIKSLMTILRVGFNPQGAGDTRAIMQFKFSGEVEGSCYFKIENGTIEATAGTAEKPDLTIEAPFEVWADIITGKADGTQMLVEQKYTAEGDLSLLMKMNQLFGG